MIKASWALSGASHDVFLLYGKSALPSLMAMNGIVLKPIAYANPQEQPYAPVQGQK